MDQSLENLKERVKEFLPLYLQMNGINTSKQFKCISPEHKDSHPSCGVIKSNPKVGHCMSCGFTFDIFAAASILEGKAETGPNWLKDNLFYLAERFGVEIPNQGVQSNEEQYKMELFSAYRHASKIITELSYSPIVHKKLADYKWSTATQDKLGIGSVKSYSDYIQKMTKTYNYSLKFLEDADLANKNIFNENNLIYTMKDENGSPVGFAARDLNFEEKIKKYDKFKAEHPKSEVRKPTKYYNTGTKCKIFHKAKILYNFDQAKKSKAALVIFEGQADAVTAFEGGIKSAVAIGSTAFSREHIELIVKNEIEHLVFVLDDDKAGYEATSKIMNVIEGFSPASNMRVEAIQLTDGHDPDSFIRSFPTLEKGVKNFRRLPRTDVFSWQIQKGLEEGRDPITLSNESILKIVDQPNFLFKEKMIDDLSRLVEMDKVAIKSEVNRITLEQATTRKKELEAGTSALIEDLIHAKEMVQAIQLKFEFMKAETEALDSLTNAIELS